MTNAQIIFNEAQDLAEQGVIKYTGRVYKAELPDGSTIEVKETEAIHTYQKWKELGYQVQKGQKAVAKITIWKHTVKKAKSDNEEDETRMFMKTSAFFSESQVEKIEK